MANLGNHAGFLDSQKDFCQTFQTGSRVEAPIPSQVLLIFLVFFVLPQEEVDLMESIS